MALIPLHPNPYLLEKVWYGSGRVTHNLQINRVFVALHRLSPVAASGGFSPVAVHGLLIVVGFSCCRAQTLEHAGFRRCSLWALELRLGSCGAPA